jgi:hypothetical protein
LAEFPIAAEATAARIPTGWTPGQPPTNFHVFTVVVSTNDDWLTINRQLTPADANQHLFNVTRAIVTMTTNVNSQLRVVGSPVFSPNGDGFLDSVGLAIDFQRQGLVQLEFRNERGETVHVLSVPLGTNGQATTSWDGYVTGQGTLAIAPDGRYTLLARLADGGSTEATASTVVEVRARSRYLGTLQSAGLTNRDGAWHTLWTHLLGGTIHTNDVIRLQYAANAAFTNLLGDRLVARAELSALFDDVTANLASLTPDSNGVVQVAYRLRVQDEVGNVGLSPVVPVALPAAGRLKIVSVSPANGATNVSTEPSLVVRLAEPSPFPAADLPGLFSLTPSIARSVVLAGDRRQITLTPAAPFTPGTQVAVALRLFPNATGTNVHSWSFGILPSNLVSRALTARIVGLPDSINQAGGSASGFVLVTNRGNVPARLSLSAGTPSTNAVSVAASNPPAVLWPSNQLALSFSLSLTGAYQGTGSVTAPLQLVEQSVGTVTSLVATLSIASLTNPPVLTVFTPSVNPSNALLVSFAGRTTVTGSGITLARVNNGAWWVVAQEELWSFTASFLAAGDTLEILARDEAGRTSASYRYVAAGSASPIPPLLAIDSSRALAWDVQLGRGYSIEWSTNLIQWATLSGLAQQTGATVTVSPGPVPLQLTNSSVGRVSVRLAPDHEAALSTNAFFRVRITP